MMIWRVVCHAPASLDCPYPASRYLAPSNCPTRKTCKYNLCLSANGGARRVIKPDSVFWGVSCANVIQVQRYRKVRKGKGYIAVPYRLQEGYTKVTGKRRPPVKTVDC
eukprot:1158691-Pelagomonas_calceolata.AAC.3